MNKPTNYIYGEKIVIICISTFNYLKISAKMKVMAGRILAVAEANVAEVYVIPTKYKF